MDLKAVAEEHYRAMKEAGVLKNTIMVFGQMNEPPGARFRVGHAALTMAEYFRDDAHQDVLLLIDNIYAVLHRSKNADTLFLSISRRYVFIVFQHGFLLLKNQVISMRTNIW